MAPPPRHPRKVVCTIATGRHRELLEISRPSFEQYAANHDYELLTLDHLVAPNRPPSWSKVVLMHRLVQEYDIVLWVDSDVLFADTTRDVADEMRPRRFLHVVEFRLGADRVLNCGVMAIRGGALSRRFLERVWNQHDLAFHPWWENAAVLRLLGYRIDFPIRPERPSPWIAGVGRLDVAWNSIPAYSSPAPVIAHFPATPHDERVAAIRTIAG